MASIKDMMFHMTELRRENDDLKEQIDHHLNQQKWFMDQIDGLQKEYGSCYYHYSLCSLELYELKQQQQWYEFQSQLTPKKPLQESPQKPQQQEHLGMLEADVESLTWERQKAHQQKQKQAEHVAMLQADAESYAVERYSLKLQVVQQKHTNTLLNHYKTQLQVFVEKSEELQAEVQSFKNKVNQDKQQTTSVRKKLKESQEDVEMKNSHIKNQKDTIHRLQNNNIVMSEKLAVTEGMLREAKKEVGIATDLFNELSGKCTQMKNDQAKTTRELNQTINSLRATNTKMVQKAVEQAKIIQKLNSKVHVTFQVDKETTAEVMREGYSDLQKFVEQKATQMEHVLALVAYALTHLKFVIERFVFERFEGSEGRSGSIACDFLNQVVNQLTRIFLIIPIPVMTRNIDRLTELAAEQCVSMKALHLIQYILPQTIEEAQASRQRAVLDNFPQLNEFFTTERATNDDTVCMSVNGFMMLIGISK